MALTEAEAFLDEAKVLQGKVKWRRRPEASFLYIADARVLLTAAGDDQTLDLVPTYNAKAQTVTFVLRYGKSENIRRLDFNKPHMNPGPNPEKLLVSCTSINGRTRIKIVGLMNRRI